ncbi:MAG: aminotransferase class V-fold PLP-dependent enzyme [Turneriella sp.]
MKAKIYLDFNSTHPPDRAILAEARAFYLEHFANSSGLSLESQLVNKRIEAAREDIAGLFGIEPKQVLFTSCATESNNLLIRELHRRHNGSDFRVITSPFEHPSVSEVLRTLDNTDLKILKATPKGGLETGQAETMDWSADLIATMAVQNESGIVLPVEQLLRYRQPATAFLCDAAQLLPKLCPDGPDTLKPGFIRTLTAQGCYVTATGHKLGGGFGCGLLITPEKHPLNAEHPLLAGGNQEFSLRAGSHNIEAIMALSLALRKKVESNNYALWRQRTTDFEKLLTEKLSFIAGFEIIGSQAERAPGTTLLLLPEVPIDFLVMALDKEGITVSTGTSCKSRARTPSQALLAMGYSEAEALSLIRLSYAQHITEQEMHEAAEAIEHAARALL